MVGEQLNLSHCASPLGGIDEVDDSLSLPINHAPNPLSSNANRAARRIAPNKLA
jgi:hypothetical protein